MNHNKAQSKLTNGLIHYYYGMGNGKTSIGLGHVVRALGHDLKPVVLQFLKKHDPTGEKGYYSGEYVIFTTVLNVPVYQFGNFGFVRTTKQIQDSETLAQQGLEKIKEVLSDPENDLVILDEIGSLIELNLFDPQILVEILKKKQPHIEVIMTGHDSVPEFTEIADYLVKLSSEKHPFQKGIQERAGIEF